MLFADNSQDSKYDHRWAQATGVPDLHLNVINIVSFGLVRHQNYLVKKTLVSKIQVNPGVILYIYTIPPDALLYCTNIYHWHQRSLRNNGGKDEPQRAALHRRLLPSFLWRGRDAQKHTTIHESVVRKGKIYRWVKRLVWNYIPGCAETPPLLPLHVAERSFLLKAGWTEAPWGWLQVKRPLGMLGNLHDMITPAAPFSLCVSVCVCAWVCVKEKRREKGGGGM